jgi:hypothetical protein
MGLGTGGAAHAHYARGDGMHRDGMHGDHHFRNYENNYARNYQNQYNIIPPDFALCPPDNGETMERDYACAPAVKARVRTSLR